MTYHLPLFGIIVLAVILLVLYGRRQRREFRESIDVDFERMKEEEDG